MCRATTDYGPVSWLEFGEEIAEELGPPLDRDRAGGPRAPTGREPHAAHVRGDRRARRPHVLLAQPGAQACNWNYGDSVMGRIRALLATAPSSAGRPKHLENFVNVIAGSAFASRAVNFFGLLGVDPLAQRDRGANCSSPRRWSISWSR